MNYSNNPRQTPINPEQFRKMVPSLSQSFLQQLVQQAKEKGISEQDIESGLKFIQSMK